MKEKRCVLQHVPHHEMHGLNQWSRLSEICKCVERQLPERLGQERRAANGLLSPLAELRARALAHSAVRPRFHRQGQPHGFQEHESVQAKSRRGAYCQQPDSRQ